jgi:hypothetical protein
MASDSTILDLIRAAMAKTTAAMARHRASHALIGGLAASYHAQPRFTKDLDLIVQVPQFELAQLLEDLASGGFELDLLASIREWNEHHLLSMAYQGIRVDWLKPVLPIYAHILDRATKEIFLGQEIRVARPEGLILLKLLAFRLQDRIDKDSGFQLFNDITDELVTGVVRSQSDPGLVYACRLGADGSYSCCTQNFNVRGGLRGSICKHLLVLIIGLIQLACWIRRRSTPGSLAPAASRPN